MNAKNNKIITVLYIAMCAPYDTVSHAGGQTLNYYIKRLAKEDDIKVDIVAYTSLEEANKIDTMECGIGTHLIIRKNDFKNKFDNFKSINSKINPWHRFCNIMTRNASLLLRNKLEILKNQGYYPDLIIMEWTQITLQIDEIKKVFPKSKYLASEHDVTFLGAKRKAEAASGFVLKRYKAIQYRNTKKRELEALSKCDLIMTHNQKDKDLLMESGIVDKKIFTLIPFYHKSKLVRKQTNNDILYFGYMKRPENIITANWFIDNVMPLIEDLPCRFVIIGGGTPESLKLRESSKINIVGYVPEVDEYFAHAMCFVAPIQLGAGIKVKILEAMYSGIPVLTNDLGIEGISARNQIDYIHCKSKEDYADEIRKLMNHKEKREISGTEFVENIYSLEKAYKDYLYNIRRTIYK